MSQVINYVAEWRTIAANLPADASIGLVPTMGNLHQGHASLLAQARAENSVCILTLFINPTQFNNPNDLQNYPKTLQADLALARECQVDYVFVPTAAEMYPDHYTYQVHETEKSQVLEGVYRPQHFNGMLTIVLKLLTLFMPQKAYFGEKDFQQLQLVRGLCQAFFLKTDIIACPTVRDAQGLALSSRNGRLGSAELALAQKFARCLREGRDCAQIQDALSQLGIQVDYVQDWQNRRLAAVHIGAVRLIDNIALD